MLRNDSNIFYTFGEVYFSTVHPNKIKGWNLHKKMTINIAVIFGISQSQFEGIRESRKGSDKLNPYIVLGCSSNDDFKTIRKKYLQLSKEHHPDVLMSKGVPQEVIEESKKKMRAINSAFDQIEKMKS